MGHDIRGVTTGSEAIAELDGGTFDLVFLDVFMQGGGAITLIHDVSRVAPGVPIVVITGKAGMLDSPILKDGMRLASAKIAKTATLSSLDQLVHRLTRASRT